MVNYLGRQSSGVLVHFSVQLLLLTVQHSSRRISFYHQTVSRRLSGVLVGKPNGTIINPIIPSISVRPFPSVSCPSPLGSGSLYLSHLFKMTRKVHAHKAKVKWWESDHYKNPRRDVEEQIPKRLITIKRTIHDMSANGEWKRQQCLTHNQGVIRDQLKAIQEKFDSIKEKLLKYGYVHHHFIYSCLMLPCKSTGPGPEPFHYLSSLSQGHSFAGKMGKPGQHVLSSCR